MTLSQHDIEKLTVEERLDLIERVWDSLAVTQDDVPLTDSQRAELDRRMDELEWDRQIESDIRSGRLDKLAEEAVAEHREGKTRDIRDIQRAGPDSRVELDG